MALTFYKITEVRESQNVFSHFHVKVLNQSRCDLVFCWKKLSYSFEEFLVINGTCCCSWETTSLLSDLRGEMPEMLACAWMFMN